MKTLLVPVEAGDALPTILETAARLARQRGSFIEGLAVGARFDALMTYEGPIVAEALTRSEEQSTVEELAEQFAQAMQAHDIPRVEQPEAKACFRWRSGDYAHETFVGNHSRVFDTAIVGRPRREGGSPSITIVEAILFEGGRPVLVAPPEPPSAEFGKSILIAWNCSTESARAVTFAMPLLRSAERVVVLTIEGGVVQGPSGNQLREALAAHGIAAEEATVSPGTKTTGEAILAEADARGADLIVKGAFTQSRLRQMIFGGATRHLLFHSKLPTFMAN